MHCHLAFYDNPIETARELAALGIACLNATVTPAEFKQVSSKLGPAEIPLSMGRGVTATPDAGPLGIHSPMSFDCGEASDAPNVRTGIGLHPWWIADGRASAADAKRTAELAANERYVAEVGLDFARGANAREAQAQALDAILAACEDSEHVLSLHAVRSADAVLDLLEKHHTCGRSHAILHWFSGTSDELARARRMGCLFSVNPRMLAARKGREYARQIPLAQLLLETDLPYEKDGPVPRTAEAHAELLRQTLADLCELRDEDVADAIAATSKHLLQL